MVIRSLVHAMPRAALAVWLPRKRKRIKVGCIGETLTENVTTDLTPSRRRESKRLYAPRIRYENPGRRSSRLICTHACEAHTHVLGTKSP
eukprot:3885936-Pleurochrysis_carterae.AAC.2